jgi:endonuclease YncB( thermonuclease family)
MPRNFLTKRKRKAFLQKVEYKDVPFFSLNGYKTSAKCVKVYDGDTATFVFYYHKKPYKFRVRLADIDTAELRSKNADEVHVAKLAKNKLINLIDDKLVYIECLGFDKYGRLLANLYSDKKMERSYNSILLEEGFAYNYKGGKKIDFKDWYKN